MAELPVLVPEKAMVFIDAMNVYEFPGGYPVLPARTRTWISRRLPRLVHKQVH